ncbi:MAG TPA: AsmA-like C-terminal region-containing protein [Myxococcales bacterium]|nr:AsmA-like C-terminal region-containing protein [Myxococcales bacterium]
MAILVVVVAAGVLALDRILLSIGRRQAATLSQELSRPIALQGISVKLWGGLGVKVSGVSIGPGPGERVALIELPRAEVSVGVFRAVVSRGKEIVVHEAVVHGLRVNVEKLPGGTTNLEALAHQLQARSAHQPAAEQPPKQAQPGAQPAPPAVEVGRAAVEDARFSFLDRTVPGAKELFVDHFDAEVRDLAVGKPLELVVKAAVLADRQNLELRVKAAPLPPSLVPVPEQVTLQVQPIDLTPLAPFLPKSVGLQGGRFQADLKAALGSAVPGGRGPSKILGGFKATQLAFAGQAGGKRLDASLDADVTADPKAGDLDLRKLELVIGPAALSGHGRATGLLGDSPRVEGLEITSRGLDPAALTEYYPPLRTQMGGAVVAGPVGITVRGQGTATAQRVELRVDLTPVRIEVPHQVAKAAGGPLLLTATADAAQGGGRVGFDGNLDLGGVDLRPGGAVAKKPGDPLAVKVAGAYRRSGDAQEVTISQLLVNVLGDPLVGKGQVKVAGAGKSRTTRFDAELSGDRLDLDRLLLETPAAKPQPKPAEKPAQPGPGAFAGLSGEARLRLGLLRIKKTEARNVLATIKVQEDTVTLDQAQLQAFGGTVSAAGTLVRLAHPQEPFKVVTKMKGVEAAQALGLFTSQKVLSGALDMDLELNGPGLGKVDLLKAITGAIEGDLRGGAFHGKDLIASVAAPLAGKLPFAKKVSEGGSTSLGKDLPFAVKVANGVAQLTKPIKFDTGQGEVQLGGGVGLDGTLQMPATVALAPDVIARITGGRIKPSEPVPLSFRLAGPATSPRLDGLDVNAAAKALGAQAATGALGKALGLEPPAAGGQGTGAGKPGHQPSPKQQLEDQAAKKLKGLFGK